MNNIDLNKYADFVLSVCSDQSKDLTALIEHLKELDANTNVNLALLMTASTSLGSSPSALQALAQYQAISPSSRFIWKMFSSLRGLP